VPPFRGTLPPDQVDIMDLAALIAFAGLIAGQFSAVIAVHALRQDEEPAHSDRKRMPAVPAPGAQRRGA
jgi:hypothetical protein